MTATEAPGVFAESHSLKSASIFLSAVAGAADLTLWDVSTGAGAAEEKGGVIARQLKDSEMAIFVRVRDVGVNLSLGGYTLPKSISVLQRW